MEDIVNVYFQMFLNYFRKTTIKEKPNFYSCMLYVSYGEPSM